MLFSRVVSFTIYTILIILIDNKLIIQKYQIILANNNNDIHIHDTLTITTQELIAGDVFFEILEPFELGYTYRLRPALDFGATFNASFKLQKVALVPTIPSDACSDILNVDDINGKVALIERGICSFLSKTINVEKVGAKAVIITESDKNSLEYDYYIEMIHDNTNRETNIPAGFLLGKNGRIIKKTLEKLRKKYAIINIPVNLTFTPPQNINYPPWIGW